ncbi:hypothetical protein L596_000313 [Steinernema carpocapsae]|uniref:Uncharacterized protein n=1 Tax=Steinernema carpocapsae TaxID=34508 RepID=A0A4V6I730_STECR|nr:hypothetical protein L596_000313 [Steinernema carpocapsae]
MFKIVFVELLPLFGILSARFKLATFLGAFSDQIKRPAPSTPTKSTNSLMTLKVEVSTTKTTAFLKELNDQDLPPNPIADLIRGIINQDFGVNAPKTPRTAVITPPRPLKSPYVHVTHLAKLRNRPSSPIDKNWNRLRNHSNLIVPDHRVKKKRLPSDIPTLPLESLFEDISSSGFPCYALTHQEYQ